jgi:hypothetical protein
VNIQEYTKWLDTRGPAGSWDIQDCRAADALIKEKTMENVTAWAERNIPNTHARKYFVACVSLHLGSVEVDEMLTKLGLYPAWMG